MSEELSDDWDQETMIELRRFALEQAVIAHTNKTGAAIDLGQVFKDADRIVNYVVGELEP
ncbi:MAG: hypothetical protein U1E03_00900 [Hyphomonadaceae bacterium]